MANIFEQASATKLRFASDRGELTTEQLWDLPLQSKTQFDLDTLAKGVNAQLKAVAEESFVSTSSNPASTRLTLQLDILKHIISVKLNTAAAAKDRAARSAEREKLVSILADKQDEQLKSLTPEELAKRIAELS